MKKKKPNEQFPADFKNNPFKSLKGFTPPPATPDKKAALPRKKEEKPEDESALFFRAVSGARKIEEDEAPISDSVPQGAQAKPSHEPPEDNQLFLQAMQKIGTTIKDIRPPDAELHDPERRSSSSRVKQLKRGTIRISAELDLHGFLKDEALSRLEHFIAVAYGRGQQAVLVITGKGINSPEGPVLQGAVSSWLSGKGKGMVVEFAPAPRDRGGSGAFVVFLKKK
jgi:DNA-nicking Smr family endonuclease